MKVAAGRLSTTRPAGDGRPSRATGTAELPAHAYRVYGTVVHSETPLSLPRSSETGTPAVTLAPAYSSWFAEKTRGVPLIEVEPNWYRTAHLPDGSIYVRWEGWFHFLVSGDGSRVFHGLLAPAPTESFQTYLLNQALSFALVKLGREPLHATTVVAGGAAIGFMGSSGLGKSTLAACFLAAGARLLTDDLLLVSPDDGLAQPGPQRIKLLPDARERFLHGQETGTPMNRASGKSIIALRPEQCCDVATPLRRLYALSYPEAADDASAPRLEAMTEQESLVQLLGSTFNSRIRTRTRLKRQFECCTQLARTIGVRRLTYTREMSRLGDVRDLILADLQRP